jgi:SAM-dependent methyltransferase
MSLADVEAHKRWERESWAKGNYAPIAELLGPASVALVDACAISAGQEVLDVAAGNGNLAVAAAKEGAKVVASDLSPGMVELGRARTEAEGLDVDWVEADAEELPFEDARFDCAASVFGAMFAPRPKRAAAELFRVVRPGGTVGMATWPEGGLAAGMFEIGSKYRPADRAGSEGAPPAILWGDEGVIRERFEGLAASIGIHRGTLTYRFPSLEAGVEFYERNSPNFEVAREGLPPERYAEMRADFRELLARWATADGALEIDADYVLIVARKRG